MFFTRAFYLTEIFSFCFVISEYTAKLKLQIPNVDKIFNLHHRIGEGTFSTVYLASLKGQQQKDRRQYFAVKHLIPTIHPEHVERELRCMLEIG